MHARPSARRALVAGVLAAALALPVSAGVASASAADPLPPVGSSKCEEAVANNGAVLAAKAQLEKDQSRLATLVSDRDSLPTGTTTLPAALVSTIATLLGVDSGPTTTAQLAEVITSQQNKVSADQTAVTNAEGTARGSLCSDGNTSGSTRTPRFPRYDPRWGGSAGSDCDDLSRALSEDVAAHRVQDGLDAAATADQRKAAADRVARADRIAIEARDRVTRDHVSCATSPAPAPAAPTTTAPAPSSSTTTPTTPPKVDSTIKVNPQADDGSKATTSGSQIDPSSVPSGSVDTGEYDGPVAVGG